MFIPSITVNKIMQYDLFREFFNSTYETITPELAEKFTACVKDDSQRKLYISYLIQQDPKMFMAYSLAHNILKCSSEDPRMTEFALILLHQHCQDQQRTIARLSN